MRIGINATCFNDNPAGAKKRFISIYKRVFSELKNCEFVIFEPKDSKISKWFSKNNNIKYVQTNMLSTNALQRYFFGLFEWPRYFKKYNFEIFEWFHLPLSYNKNTNVILTIHDLRYVEIPSYYSFFRRIVAKNVLVSSLSKASKTITVSETMKTSISKFAKKDSINVIYNGLDDIYNIVPSTEDINKIKKKYQIDYDFILTVGSLEKRKNLSTVLKSIGLLNSLGFNKKLIIVGGFYNDSKNIISTRKLLNINKDVKILNKVTDFDLKCLYKLAEIFVFPSIYEGFGIPLIEAMYMKCSVIASDLKCFRELGGTYIDYFDPSSEEELCSKIIHLSNKKNIDSRKLDNAYNVSLKFNYDQIYKKVLHTYTEVSNKNL